MYSKTSLVCCKVHVTWIAYFAQQCIWILLPYQVQSHFLQEAVNIYPLTACFSIISLHNKLGMSTFSHELLVCNILHIYNQQHVRYVHWSSRFLVLVRRSVLTLSNDTIPTQPAGDLLVVYVNYQDKTWTWTIPHN